MSHVDESECHVLVTNHVIIKKWRQLSAKFTPKKCYC